MNFVVLVLEMGIRLYCVGINDDGYTGGIDVILDSADGVSQHEILSKG